jgi:hypothetical protein
MRAPEIRVKPAQRQQGADTRKLIGSPSAEGRRQDIHNVTRRGSEVSEGSEDIICQPLRRTRFQPPAARASTSKNWGLLRFWCTARG